MADNTRSADLVVDVRDERWSVLFFDPRASWLSTFVRRAVERDPRFVVTSRIVTSRGVTTDAGQPPGRLDDFAAMSLFDAVVVGAPEALTERDVAGLEAYLRRRGGSVILLLDERASGAYDRLTRVRTWSTVTNSAGFAIATVGADSAELRATAVAWPAALPSGARPLAISRPVSNAAAEERPAIWRMAVGAGELVVSGALDAWRYRDPAQSRFDIFWRSMVADAAASNLPPIEITPAATVLAPGERTSFRVRLRDASLAELSATRPVRASVSAMIEMPGGRMPLQLWPEGPPGSLAGEFRTPAIPGAYRIVVTSDGYRAESPFVVTRTPSRISFADAGIVAAWARSRGGDVIASTSLDELVPALERTLNPVDRRETWYPMRSAWWILPFALLLGAEWLWRRRRGLA